MTDEQRAALARAVDKAHAVVCGAADASAPLICAVVAAAAEYFAECPSDFCIQTIGHECIVFGGTNRLTWGPRYGFSPDPSYCTAQFLVRCDRLGRLPNRELLVEEVARAAR